MTESAWSPQREDPEMQEEEEFTEADERSGEMPPRLMSHDAGRGGDGERSNGESRDEHSSSDRDGRSGSNGGRTYRQLYAEAQRRGLDGRSKMSKAQLERALS